MLLMLLKCKRPASRRPRILAADAGRLARRGRVETLDEVERGLGDLLPAVVDGQRMAAARHLLDLGDVGLCVCRSSEALAIARERCGPSRRRGSAAGPARGSLSTFVLGPGVEVGVAHLGQPANPVARPREFLVERLRLVLVEGVRQP